jgi:hypothetical protein
MSFIEGGKLSSGIAINMKYEVVEIAKGSL